jgi:signal peptidase II
MSEPTFATEPEAAPPPSASPERGGPELPLAAAQPGGRARPSYVFFGALAALSLIADVATKAWAEIALSDPSRAGHSIPLIDGHLAFTLAYNRGGAWGLLQNADENIRRPFFVIVSIAAVLFIVSLYSRLAPTQRALKWGLPLVLGGALGNLADRVVRTSVVDFIDYRGDWIRVMNEGIAAIFTDWNVTDHWPTFNVADMCICTGVALMAIDMIGSRQEPEPASGSDGSPPASGAGPTTTPPLGDG